jgi:hypothetical protein
VIDYAARVVGWIHEHMPSEDRGVE